MDDVDGDAEGSVPEARAKVSVRCTVSCTGSIGFRLEFGSVCDVRDNVKLMASFTMRCG